MAIDQSAVGSGGGVMSWINEHPTLALAGAVALALAIGAFVMNRQPQQQGPAADGPQADLSSLDRDSAGNPVVYRHVADYFYNTSIIEDSYNTETTTTTTSTVTNSTGPNTPIQGNPPNTSTGNQAGSWSCSRSVRGGETLSAIAAEYGIGWPELYQRNKSSIDSTSHQHGDPIPGGPWNNIWPGQVLTVPCR